jgi:hypothetical protein
MYSINLTGRFTLINQDECQAKFGSSIDPRIWLSAIEVAEVRFAQLVLGYDFYNSFCAQKNVVIDSGNIAAYQAIFDTQYPPANTVVLKVGYIVNAIELVTDTDLAALWNNFLWRYIYECVYFIALPKNYTQFSSAGIQKNNPIGSIVGDSKPSNSVGVDLKDIKYLQDRQLLDTVNPLQSAVEQYLCVNKSLFPLWDNSVCDKYEDNDVKKLNNKRTNPFIDIYPDECNRDRWQGSGYYAWMD